MSNFLLLSILIVLFLILILLVVPYLAGYWGLIALGTALIVVVVVGAFLWALHPTERDMYADGYSLSEEDLQKAKFLRLLGYLDDSLNDLDSKGFKKRLAFYKTLDPEELRKELYNETTIETLKALKGSFNASQEK